MKKQQLTALALAVLLAASSLASCAQTEPKEPGEETNPSPEAVNADAPVTGDSTDFSSMSFTEKLSYDRSLIPDNLPERDEGGADFRIGFLDFGGPGMYTQDWIAEELTGDVLNDAVFNRNAAVEDRFNIKISMVSHPNDNYSTAFTSTVIAGGRRVRYGFPASRSVQLVYAVGTFEKALGS